MSNSWHVQAWYSLASVTGLSLVSLGSPGLRSEMDEQIFTGGTTAVAQLLGEEVGGMSDDFIGGGPTSRFGRVTIQKEEQQFFALFLLVSPKDPLPEPLVEFSREFILAFSEKLLETQGSRLASGFEQIEHYEVEEEFKEALKLAKKRIRVPSDDDFLKNEIESILQDALSEFAPYPSLRALVDDDRPTREMLSDLRQNQSKYIEKLSQELYLRILKINPLPLVLCSKLSQVNNIIAERTTDILPKIVQKPEFHQQFEKIVEAVKDTDIPLILQSSSDIISTAKGREAIQNKISSKLAEGIRENHPLALIANPAMSFGTISVKETTATLVNILIEKHDLGNTLRKLIVDLSGDPMCGLEIGDFVRYFSSRFPRGISPIGWSFIKYIFGSLADSKKDINELLKTEELPKSHVETLKNEFKGRIKESLEGVMVALEEGSGDEISTFFDAISASVARGVAQFFDAVVGTYRKPGRLYHDYSYRLEDFCANADALYAAYRIIGTLASRKRDYPYLTDAIPSPKFLVASETAKMDVAEILSNPTMLSQLWKSEETFSKAFLSSAVTLFDSQLSQFQKHHHNAYDTIISLLKGTDKCFDELEREKKPKVIDLVKNCEDLRVIPEEPANKPLLGQLYLELAYLSDAQLELREFLEKVKDYLNQLSRGKSVSKKVGKEKNRVAKTLDRLEKTRSILDARMEKMKDDFEKRINKEASKSRKDLKKLRRDLGFKMIRLSNSRNGASFPTSRDFLQTIQDRMQSYGDEDQYLSELGSPAWLYAWASILQKPPESALNKAFRDALTADRKKIPLVKEIVQEITDSEDYELAEILRDKLRVKTRRILHQMTTALSDARPWFLAQDPTVFRVTSDGKKDVYLVKIGELPKESLTPNVREWFQKWDSAAFVFQDGKAEVCLNLDMEGEIGERSKLSEALAKTGIATLKRRYKPYLDILETSCGVLSSSRKEAFQKFFRDLEEQIDNAVQ